MKVFILALIAIAVAVVAQFLLRAGMTSAPVQEAIAANDRGLAFRSAVMSAQVIFGLGLYVLGAGMWLAVLAKWDVSKAYPLVGLGFALTVVIGWLLGEPLTWSRVVGVAFICVGVTLVGRS